MRRRLLLRLVALLVGIVVALAIGEGLCRIFWKDLATPAQVEIRYPLAMPALLTGADFGLAANAEFHGIYDGDPYGNLPPDHRVVYRTNELGFRDEPYGPRLESDGTRVLVLGDSFTLGEGVAEAERYTEVVERAGAARTGKPFTVFNAGVSGYSSLDESIAARELVPLVRPRAVLLGYCLNDPVHLMDERYPGFDLIMLRDARPPAGGHGGGDSPFRLVSLVRSRFRAFRLTRETLAWYGDLYAGEDAPWTASRHYLLEMRDTAARSGAAFAVVVFPILYHAGNGYPFEDAHRTIVSFCRENGVPVLDARPLFEGLDDADLVVHPKDHHPNAEAHRRVGEAAATFLTDEVLER